MDVKNLNVVPSFTTKDSSEIRELLSYRNSSIRNQSLAEARVPIGGQTIPHYHIKAEEIYFITEGQGVMTIEGQTQHVSVGDAVSIPPGQIHQISNDGSVVLRLLCCCSPPYEDDDTVLIKS